MSSVKLEATFQQTGQDGFSDLSGHHGLRPEGRRLRVLDTAPFLDHPKPHAPPTSADDGASQAVTSKLKLS